MRNISRVRTKIINKFTFRMKNKRSRVQRALQTDKNLLAFRLSFSPFFGRLGSNVNNGQLWYEIDDNKPNRLRVGQWEANIRNDD